MDVASAERRSGSQIDRYPLLMEQVASHTRQQHVIDVEANNDASSSSSHDDQHPGVDSAEHEDSLSSGIPASSNQSDENSSNRLNASNPSMRQGGDGYRQNHRSPLNSGLWISVELVVTVGQIIASVVVLSLSRHENPQAPLFVWVVGYASGCVATLPLLYWRYCSRMRGSEQESNESHQGTSHSNRTEPRSYTAISVTQSSDEDSQQTGEPASRNGQIVATLNSRFNGLVDHFKMALDCFFAVWFVVGNVWIFGGHSSPSDAPKLYRLCIVFLTFSCIGYAMPFILCATICCCLPCIMSVLGFREDFSQTRGATLESINALPTYKFKLKQDLSAECGDVNPGRSEGGVLAVGTEKERFMSGEDAVCCICLARYADDDELKELPCFHVFHVECIDKWLKINALCPLCKKEISESSRSSLSDGDRGS